MEKTNIQKILNYYLEYEIYNIITTSKIKINNKTSLIIKDIQNSKDICENIEKLKERNIRDKIEKFIGIRANNKKEIIDLIEKELINLDKELSNKEQIVFRISSIIKQNIQYKKGKNFEKTIDNFSNKICEIMALQEFWLYAYNLSFMKEVANKLPIFILKCKIENNEIIILEANINTETLYTILSINLKKDISDIIIEYEEKVSNYNKEIKSSIDGGNIQHILDIYCSKLKEYINISKEDIKNISKINSKYNMNEEYIISIDEIGEESLKSIKEDIELLIKLIDNNNYIPNLLEKYLKGNKNKNDINDEKYKKIYKGNYKSSYGVGENQYKIINAINNNDLISIEGPPGTGKTSLLKEIIANKIVERANLILKNWNQKLEENKYNGTTYYDINWFKKDKNTIKSIVVSSKNSEAIENVGKEINKEITYISSIASKYIRTQKINNKIERNTQNYKGIVCLPLGKKDNIQDFKEFLYDKYIPMLENIQTENYSENEIIEIKEKYENKIKQIETFEQLVNSLNNI